MTNDTKDWFSGLVPLQDGASERVFCDGMRDQLAQVASSEFIQAVRCGWLAQSLSQVFIAGYQAAIRKTFPKIELSGITAFAVSEDRSETSPLPGVIWHPDSQGVLLSGYKTWVAAIAQVEQLVIKARGEEAGQSGYFLVPVQHKQVHLEAYPSPSRLPDLSQGRVFLDEVILPMTSRLDASAVSDFGRHEALMIYSAFLAMVARHVPQDAVEQGAAVTLLHKLESYFKQPSSGSDLQALDEGVQLLLAQMADGRWLNNQLFQRDKNLIAMYSRGLRNH